MRDRRISLIGFFSILLMGMILIAGCSFGIENDDTDSNTDNESSEDTGSISLSISYGADSQSGDPDIYTSVISKAVITIESSDFSESFFQVIEIENGTNSSPVTIEDVPVGKNRIISVQACQDDSVIPGLVLRCVTDIDAKDDNAAAINWSTTALGNVYYKLLKSKCRIASFSDSIDEELSEAVDSTATNALLVDASSVASDYLNGSLKSKSAYVLSPGTVSFTLFYPIESFTAYFNEPGSSSLTDCIPGKTYTFENCSPGNWTLFLVDEKNSKIIGTESLVSVSSEKNIDVGVVSYEGIMIAVDATLHAEYKNIYAWNYNGEGDAAYGKSYPGSQMTQYGDFYIKAYESADSLSVIANSGSGDTNKLYGENVDLEKRGVYLLTNEAPGYTLLSKAAGSSGDGYEDPAKMDFNNILYINLSDGSWSTTETGTYAEITTKKTTVGTDSNYVKLQITKDDEGNATDLIEINAKNSDGVSAFYFTGTKTNGGVKIQSNGTDDIMVFLNDVTMTSSNYPCFEVTKGSKTYFTSTGENKLVDGRVYGTGYGEEFSTSSSDTYEDDDGNTVSCTVSKLAVREGSASKATLYSKGNMILTGSGTLEITESYKNCIGSKGFITVVSGTYNLTSNAKNGFDARYGFTQDGGDITFTGNGAITASSSLSTSAYVKKANGIVVDGIISSTDNGWIKINGGSYTCNATYGKGMNAKWDSTEDTEDDGTSTTGKPDPSVYITGGKININVTGTGWTNDDNNARSAKHYYDADGVAQYEIVKCAAEGIESASKINISGGTIEVTADNDCINASLTGGSVNISGGSLYCATGSADAIDSNGNITVTGGTVLVCAPMGSEDGLDCGDGGYSVKITGGLVASLSGSSNAAASASGCVVINGKSLSATGGNTVLVMDSSDTLLYALTVPSVSTSSGSDSGSSSGMGGMGGRGGMGGMGGMGSSSSGYGSMIFASPRFTSTGTYSICKDATVSGGTEFHGLYTALPSVSDSGSVAAEISVTEASGVYTNGSSSGYGK